MRRFFAVLVLGALVSSGVASAQSVSKPESMKGSIEAVAQSAFSNVTSQSYGAEIGVNIRSNLQIYVEAGQTRNAATAELSAAAQTVAGGLSQVASNVGFSVKAPVTFGVAGLKYLIPVEGSKVMPYVLAGGGVASVKQNTVFTVGGTDVTSNLAQFGTVLGTDTSGSFTKPMFSVGGGVAYPVWQQLVVDFQIRFGRIFAEDQGINITRAGLGIGVRF